MFNNIIPIFILTFLGIAVSELLSDALYREDWEMEKDLIYYPVNITPGYEAMKCASEYAGDRKYHAKHEETKYQNKYNHADTQQYRDNAKVREVQADNIYRKEWNEKQRHEFR